MAVFYLDLDRFKQINDELGHQAGDRVLVKIASRLRLAVRPHDTVARLGGDEFVVICGDLPDENTAILLGKRLEEALNVDLELGQGHDEMHVTGSIGMTLSHSSRDDPEGLLREADSAMYRAKSRGRGRLERFGA